jgi:hypothetical protein
MFFVICDASGQTFTRTLFNGTLANTTTTKNIQLADHFDTIKEVEDCANQLKADGLLPDGQKFVAQAEIGKYLAGVNGHLWPIWEG